MFDQFFLPTEVTKTARIGTRLGWKEVTVTTKDDKHYVTGINPETGKKDLLPVLEDLQHEAVLDFLERRLNRLEDPELRENLEVFIEDGYYEGSEEMRILVKRDEDEAEVIRDCLGKMLDGTWTWEQAHSCWLAKFNEIHEEVLRKAGVKEVDAHRHGQRPPHPGGGGGHDAERDGAGGSEIHSEP